MTDVIGGGPVIAPGDFITREDAELFLGLSSGAHAAILVPVVNGINAAIHKYLKRKILSHEETEYADGAGFLHEIYLREYPVTEIHEVSMKDLAGVWAEQPLSGYSIAVPEETGSNVGCLVSHCGPWPEGRRNIKIVYQAGYTTVPDDLKLAALQFCQELFRDARNGKKIQSERLGDYSYSLMTNNSVESLLDARRVLASYRRVSL